MPPLYPEDNDFRQDPAFRKRRRRPIYEDYDSEDDLEFRDCRNLNISDGPLIIPVFPLVNYPTIDYGFDYNYDFMFPFYSNTCDYAAVMPYGSFF